MDVHQTQRNLTNNPLIFFAIFLSLLADKSVAAKPLPVTTLPIEQIAIYPANDVPAEVLSLNESVLSAEIKGQIIEMPSEVGDKIKKGYPLARIDCSDYKLIVAQSKAELQAIQSDIDFTDWQLTKTKKLATMNNASEELVRKYEATLKKLKSTFKTQQTVIEAANNNVMRCTIISPFHGVIVKRVANIGEYATPGREIIHIIDIQNLEVEAFLHITEIDQLEKAKSILFNANRKSFPVKVRAIVPSQDPKSRTQVVRLTFEKAMPLPGTAGRLVWKTGHPAIPSEYIRQVGHDLGVFIAEGNTAKFLPLPQAIEGQPALIHEPIKSPIIIDGRYAIEDGSQLNIQSKE